MVISIPEVVWMMKLIRVTVRLIYGLAGNPAMKTVGRILMDMLRMDLAGIRVLLVILRYLVNPMPCMVL